MSIDLNADVGEGMDDAALLPFVTSANVACGLHAGDPSVMDGTVALALSRGVRVGAHPGYPDRENFGRRAVEMAFDAIENLVLFQVAALDGFVRSRGGTLTHVKPPSRRIFCTSGSRFLPSQNTAFTRAGSCAHCLIFSTLRSSSFCRAPVISNAASARSARAPQRARARTESFISV